MNKLEIVGKALLGIVEVGAGAMQSQARTRSRDRKMSEEYRNKYSEMADSFGNINCQTKVPIIHLTCRQMIIDEYLIKGNMPRTKIIKKNVHHLILILDYYP